MKAIAVYPGKAGSAHLADLSMPALDDVPGGRGVLVRLLRCGVDGPPAGPDWPRPKISRPMGARDMRQGGDPTAGAQPVTRARPPRHIDPGAERRRLEEARERRVPWYRWGPYLSERQWGTVREDYSADGERVGVLPARSRALPRVPLGRGRPARHLRPPAAALLRARPVERRGPDPQGAPVRPDRPGGQPRRGRQGVLLLPRRHADPFVPPGALQVPAAGVPVRASSCDENRAAAGPTPSSSCSTPGSSTTTATSTSTVEYAKAAPGRHPASASP